MALEYLEQSELDTSRREALMRTLQALRDEEGHALSKLGGMVGEKISFMQNGRPEAGNVVKVKDAAILVRQSFNGKLVITKTAYSSLTQDEKSKLTDAAEPIEAKSIRAALSSAESGDDCSTSRILDSAGLLGGPLKKCLMKRNMPSPKSCGARRRTDDEDNVLDIPEKSRTEPSDALKGEAKREETYLPKRELIHLKGILGVDEVVKEEISPDGEGGIQRIALNFKISNDSEKLGNCSLDIYMWGKSISNRSKLCLVGIANHKVDMSSLDFYHYEYTLELSTGNGHTPSNSRGDEYDYHGFICVLIDAEGGMRKVVASDLALARFAENGAMALSEGDKYSVKDNVLVPFSGQQ